LGVLADPERAVAAPALREQLRDRLGELRRTLKLIQHFVAEFLDGEEIRGHLRKKCAVVSFTEWVISGWNVRSLSCSADSFEYANPSYLTYRASAMRREMAVGANSVGRRYQKGR
jgi:hypothetical protein